MKNIYIFVCVFVCTLHVALLMYVYTQDNETDIAFKNYFSGSKYFFFVCQFTFYGKIKLYIALKYLYI